MTSQYKSWLDILYIYVFSRSSVLNIFPVKDSSATVRESQWKTQKTVFKHTAAAAKLLQSCSTLHDSVDGSPPGSPVHGILQARILEWVAISLSNA